MQWMRRGQFLALAVWLAATAAAQAPRRAEQSGNGAQESASRASGTVQPDKAKAYYHYTLAHLYQDRGTAFDRPELLVRAIDEMEQAIQYDPSSSFLSMELADLYASTGRWQNALQQLEENVRRNPSDPSARRLLGRLYVRLLADQHAPQVPDDLRQKAVKEFEGIVQQNPKDISSYLILAQLYRANNQNAEAESTLKKALALEPDNSEANTQLALLYIDVGDYPSAIKMLKDITAKDSDPDLLGTLAFAYEQTHDYTAAADAYSRALERDPDNSSFRKGLGQNLLLGKQYDSALEEYQSVLRSNPTDVEAYVRMSEVYRFQHKYKEAHQMLAKAEELAPDNLEIRYNEVLLDEYEGKADDAMALLQKTLQDSAKPSSDLYTQQERNNRAVFLEQLGALQSDMGKFSDAENTFHQMADLGGENASRGTVHLIEAYQESHDFDKALQESADAVKQFPNDREVLIARANLLATTGAGSDAIALLKPLLHNDAEDREVWLNLAQIHLQAKEFPQAFDAVTQADKYSESPDDKAQIYFQNGAIWERQKQFDKAEEQFRKALQLNPESAAALNYLGYMFADQGVRLDEAVDLIQRAVDMEPNNGAYLDSLGWAYYRQNRFDLAEQNLQKAVERVPGDPTILGHLGDVHFKMGQIAKAVNEWKTALEQWKRLPQGEVEPDEVASIERKLRDAGAQAGAQ